MHARLLSWSLRHRRWRHVLDGLVIAITVSIVMLFVSVVVDLIKFANISSDRALVRILPRPTMSQPGSDGLPESRYAMFQGIPGVTHVQRYKLFMGRHESGASYLISGEEDSGIELNRDFFPVEPAVFEAWKKEPKLGAIVTQATAKELGLHIGQLAEVPTPFGPAQIKVVGLSVGGPVAHRIALHFEYVRELTGNNGYCDYRLFAAHNDFQRVAKEVIERTKHSDTPLIAVSDSQMTSSWVSRVAMVPALLGFLGLFLTFTTVMTLANNRAISVRERRTELATLRVLGYRRRTIMRLILNESVIVGFLGGVLAVIVMSWVFRDGVQLTPGTERLLQKVTLTPFAIVCGFILSILIPLAGAIPAAISSVRSPLVEALRDTA